MIFSKYYYDKSLLGGKSKILRIYIYIYIAVAQICGLAKKKKKKVTQICAMSLKRVLIRYVNAFNCTNYL